MKHIIFIGFKNSGKTTIGSLLSKRINKPFIDVDEQVKALHRSQTGEEMSCRQIMKKYGENRFRELEHEALKNALGKLQECVIAVGGGAPMKMENRDLICGHVVVHVFAPKGIVFERIMVSGKPAFFPHNEEPFEGFQKLWTSREAVFKQIADISVNNNGSIEKAVEQVIKKLRL